MASGPPRVPRHPWGAERWHREPADLEKPYWIDEAKVDKTRPEVQMNIGTSQQLTGIHEDSKGQTPSHRIHIHIEFRCDPGQSGRG